MNYIYKNDDHYWIPCLFRAQLIDLIIDNFEDASDKSGLFFV